MSNVTSCSNTSATSATSGMSSTSSASSTSGPPNNNNVHHKHSGSCSTGCLGAIPRNPSYYHQYQSSSSGYIRKHGQYSFRVSVYLIIWNLYQKFMMIFFVNYSIELLKCQTNYRQSKNYHLEAITQQLIIVGIAVEIIGLIRTTIQRQVIIIIVRQKVPNLPEDGHRHLLTIQLRDLSKYF